MRDSKQIGNSTNQRDGSLKKIVPLFFGLAMTICTLSCNRKHYEIKYGVSWNAERIKRGIPTVSSNWIPRVLSGDVDFGNPDAKKTAPYHLWKRLMIDDAGNILSEYDTYYSGKTWQNLEGDTIEEELTFTYDYKATSSSNQWTIEHTIPEKVLHSFEIKTISLGEADDILRSWGLSR